MGKRNFEFQRRIVDRNGNLISYGREVQPWLEKAAKRQNENALELLKRQQSIKVQDLSLESEEGMILGILEGKFGRQKDYDPISPITKVPDLSVDYLPALDSPLSEKTFYFTLMLDGISILIGLNTCVGVNEADDLEAITNNLERDDLLPGELRRYEMLLDEYKKYILINLLSQANQS